MSAAYTITCGVTARMRDGVTLVADLWQPSTAEPRPALLYRTPYNRRRLICDFLTPLEAVQAGFAVLVQDCRGRFESGGEWRPRAWAQEAEDTYDTVEWMAQQPWCNGSVGMAGVSYSGIVQLLGASLRPPHLKAIAPAFAATAVDERAETGGAFPLDHLFGWLSLMALDWAQRRTAEGAPLTGAEWRTILEGIRNPRSLTDARPLASAPMFTLPDFPVSFEELASRPATPELDVGAIDIPILCVGGWYDLYVRGAIGAFSRSRGAPRHLLVGCWTHDGVLPACHGQVNFGLGATGAGGAVPEQHVAFFRRYLCDEGADVPPVRYFLMGTGEWRTSDAWPPVGAGVHSFYLSADPDTADGRLTDAVPAKQTSRRYVYDPSDPTPTLGGRLLGVGALAAGPFDQRPLTARADVVAFDTDPFARPFDILGSVRTVLHVSSTAKTTDFVVKLIDVAPDGLALPITDGIVRWQSREGDTTECVEPEAVSIRMADTAWRVEPRHRLRLQVQSADYPRFDANPNTGVGPGEAVTGVPARNTIWGGASTPSCVTVQGVRVE